MKTKVVGTYQMLLDKCILKIISENMFFLVKKSTSSGAMNFGAFAIHQYLLIQAMVLNLDSKDLYLFLLAIAYFLVAYNTAQDMRGYP